MVEVLSPITSSLFSFPGEESEIKGNALLRPRELNLLFRRGTAGAIDHAAHITGFAFLHRTLQLGKPVFAATRSTWESEVVEARLSPQIPTGSRAGYHRPENQVDEAGWQTVAPDLDGLCA